MAMRQARISNVPKMKKQAVFSILRDDNVSLAVKMPMLISPRATDTIYQAVLQLLKQQGVEETEPLQQNVLLQEGMFLGYRFQAEGLHIDWLAQQDILVVKNNEGGLLLLKQLSPCQKTDALTTFDSEQNPVAA